MVSDAVVAPEKVALFVIGVFGARYHCKVGAGVPAGAGTESVILVPRHGAGVLGDAAPSDGATLTVNGTGLVAIGPQGVEMTQSYEPASALTSWLIVSVAAFRPTNRALVGILMPLRRH